jgi:beta-mannanase
MRPRLRLIAVAALALTLLAIVSAGASAATLGVSGSPAQFNKLKPHGFTVLASFEAWANNRDASTQLNRSKRVGARPMITWEPWEPPPLGAKNQGARQSKYTNASIAAGRHDRYIRAFAKSIAKYRKPVLLRYAHEFPGDWYPWSIDPVEYRRAWQRIHRIFRRAGADNAKFVWSPQMVDNFLASTQPYWPGAKYVDRVATTFVYFGTWQGEPLKMLTAIGQLKSFGKPVMIAEANAAYSLRYEVLQALADFSDANPWIESVVWTQTESRAEHDWSDSRMGWSLRSDKKALDLLKSLR